MRIDGTVILPLQGVPGESVEEVLLRTSGPWLWVGWSDAHELTPTYERIYDLRTGAEVLRLDGRTTWIWPWP